ncbi:Ig-like domain-containing protein [Corallococcus sp. EGB]|uniref:Ig-like domain-containing protein n=1 Tax=Corallococcus sp. EGB TaxID=1521117 RepID=UPI001CC0BF49|nr:Ig-like domain-containing protein [Corallococcus sp. EGB]
MGFTAPQVQGNTPLAFSLVVTDADGATAGPFVYSVTVTNVNQAPVAKAQIISGVRGGEQVKLDASTSTDPDNEALTNAWMQAGGAAPTLSGANSAEASFTPAKKNTAATYTFPDITRWSSTWEGRLFLLSTKPGPTSRKPGTELASHPGVLC